MSLWAPEKLGEKAKEDAENDKYNPPHRWGPADTALVPEPAKVRSSFQSSSQRQRRVLGRLSWRPRSFRNIGRRRQALSLSISGPVLVRILYIFKLGGTIDLGNSWSLAIGDLISESQATDRSTFCPNARRKASSGLRCYPH
jgi:hypothetical protein